MARKKTRKRKATSKPATSEEKPSGPEYMVQVSDPKMVRKDILESLREMIIFMQGYEKFRRIQEEKVMTIALLKNDIKDIQNLIDKKLRKFLPKGKLKTRMPEDPEEEKKKEAAKKKKEEKEHHEEEAPPQPEEHKVNELDQLESELRNIEGQLQRFG